MRKKPRRRAHIEFVAQLRKNEKGELEVEIPEEVEESENLKEGDLVEVTLKRAKKKGEKRAPP